MTVEESTAQAESDGSWSIVLPAPARRDFWTCIARAPAFARGTYLAEIEAEAPECRVDFELETAVRFRGRVLRSDGVTPCVGAVVFLPDPPLVLGRTDEQGRFDSADCVGLSKIHLFSAIVALGGGGIGWASCIPDPAIDWDIRLQPFAVALVTVRDAEGRPLPNARLEVTSGHFLSVPDSLLGAIPLLADEDVPLDLLPDFRGQSDADGQAVLRLPVDPENPDMPAYDLAAEAEGHLPAEHRGLRLTPGATTPLVLVLPTERRCRIRGVVRNEDGVPVSGAQVGGRAESDEEGRFDLPEIVLDRAGECVVNVLARGYLPLARCESVPAGETLRSVSLVLQRALSLTGSVVDQNGHGVLGAAITVSDRFSFRRTDDQGCFEFAGLRAGEHPLRILELPPEHVGPAAPLRVRAGEPVRVTVTRVEPPSTRLDVVVVESGSLRPVRATGVRLVGLAGALRSERIQVAPGRIQATGLWPSLWRLQIEAEGYAPATVEFTVPDHTATVELRAELGPPGTITGSLEVDADCEALLPDRVTLLILPFTGHQAGYADALPGIVNLLRKRKRTFRVEGVAPCQKLRLHLLAGDAEVCGQAEVVVPPGGEAQVVVRAQRAGSLRLRTEQPLPRGRFHVITEPAGHASVWSDHEGDGRLDHALPWPAGQANLKVRFFEAVTLRARVATVQCKVTAGNTTDLTLQFVP